MSAFDQTPPNLTTDALAELAKRHFGVEGRAVLLNSERDQNARIDSAAGRYVLKVVNAAEPRAQVEMQEAVLAHLAAAGVTGIPHLVPTLTGARHAVEPVDGAECVVRLVGYIEGDMLGGVARSAAQLRDLGAFMGDISRGLAGFGDAGAFRPDFPWALDSVMNLRGHVGDIADEKRRALVEGLFARYEARVLPQLAHLRASVLHQDANDNNLVVDASNPARIIGLIDFGDMCFGRTINELAITLAYALLGAPDLYAASRAVIEGYVSRFRIEEAEADVLFDLMRMRLAASVCISSRQSVRHPENDYLLISQDPAFALLERFDAIDPEFMVALFRRAAGFDATRSAAAVRDWLAGQEMGELFAPALNRSARMALQTDGRLPGMPAYSDRAFDTWFAAERPKALPEGAAFYGFGPYGEQRGVYATDQFADVASPERRTRHLGIDVFAPAGTEVFAPLAGEVAYVTYNADPLDYGNTLILRHEIGNGVAFYTLYGHLGGTLPKLLQVGQKVEKGQLICHLGDWHENGGWAPHLHFQVMSDILQQTEGNFFGVGHDSLWDVWSDICLDPNLIMRVAPQSFEIDPNPPEVLIARRAKAIGPSLSLSYAEKLKIIGGQGAWLVDHTGQHYLDCVNNISHVGHANPRVVAALAAQAARLNTNARYLHDGIVALSERLAGKLPEGLSVGYFVNSGTEANELALRIARTALGKKNTVVLDWAYHGNSGGMVEISPYKFKRKGGFAQPEHVEIAAIPDPYRNPDAGAADVARCLEAVRVKTGGGAAAFIAESISGVGGQVVYPEGYLREAYAAVRAAGGVCIADEVQCGFGRVGSDFWGFETQGVVPDIVVMGKPMGNGHPLAAVFTTPDLAAKFANGMEYFNSFGGNPVSMAVGMAVLDVIEDEGLQARAAETGAYLLERFHEMAKRHSLIGDVRGMGLFLGIELVTDRASKAPATEAAGRIVNHMRQNGVLASTDGPLDNVLKFKPPMVFGRAEADILCAALDAAFKALAP